MKFKIAYIIFVISIILYANSRIYGITPRHAMTVVMAILCFRQSEVKWTDDYYTKYLIFTSLFGFSSLITGYMTEFFGFVVSWIIPGIIAYWSTRILRDKYHAPNLLIFTLLGIGFIDALTTIGQFMHIPFMLRLPELLRVNVDSEFVEDAESGQEFFGLTIPGLFGSDVYNGYFLMLFTVLVFYLYKYIGSILMIVIWMLAIVSLFFVQERTAFYLGIAISLFLFYMMHKTMDTTKRICYIIIFVPALMYISPIVFDFIASGDSRYTLGLDATNRDEIYAKAEIFIMDHLLFGGWFYCKEYFYFKPHNILLHAIIRAGILGLIVAIWLLAKQIYVVAKMSIQHKNDIQYFPSIVIGLSLYAFTFNSLLHNHSVIEGEVLPWLLWGAFDAKKKSIKI